MNPQNLKIDAHGLRWGWDKLGAPNPIPPEQIAAAADWIARHTLPAATICIRNTSYGLKHAVENWTEHHGGKVYTSNGAFIQAAVNAGIPLVIQEGHVNCMFKMKYIDRATKRSALCLPF